MNKLTCGICILTAFITGLGIGNYVTSKNFKYVNSIKNRTMHMHYLAIHKNDSNNFTYIFGKQDDEFYAKYMP
tara:strand:+ start:153 stop:371 length:219 start_codon:yes stop_codon:yes gene_type:complete